MSAEKTLMEEFNGVGLSKPVTEKTVNSGITYRSLKAVNQRNGVRGIITVLALPGSPEQLRDQKAKPRVTNHAKVLNKIVTYFQLNV